MDEVERARVAPSAASAASLAPQVFAMAEQERALAKKAYDEGHEVEAGLHAERALVTYQHAGVLARLQRADREAQAAEAALATKDDEARRLAAARAKVDAEGDALDKELKVVRARFAPPASGPADARREAARLVAARSLATQARLLCGAARLVGATTLLEEPEKRLDALDKTLDASAKPASRAAAIDDAARARASCLDVLTRTRRAADRSGAGLADALLAELSAAGGWDPVRDERGVVVTLRDAFHGDALTKEAEARLKELGRVLAAHPGDAAQVVVHDAVAPSKTEEAADQRRAEAAAKALSDAAGANAKVKAFAAGARAPIVDPSDAARGRNARLEVVLVTPQ